jgi:GTP-binding protein HflX
MHRPHHPHASRPTSPHERLPRSQHEPYRDGQPVHAERAVLVAVLLPDTPADLSDPLGELAALSESAGATVVDSLVQKRLAMDPATAIGKGKMEELRELAAATEADAIIFDNDLSPRQIRSLERAVGLKIIDRSELILDIFASRAQTREAQLQVELAQLEYTAPRLRGMWTHLERIAGAGGGAGVGAVGGVGTRGPGERQIEIDRRIVRGRIGALKRELGEIDRRKRREVRSRADEFTVSLVGYTNSGKTTLLNALTGAGQLAADMLFATLSTKTARWSLGEGHGVLLSDTVGFVRNLPHHLVASFRATLEETIHADLLLHVVDASSTAALGQVEAVDGVLASLGLADRREILLLNKMDLVTDHSIVSMLSIRYPEAMSISAKTGAGLDVLTRRVEGLMLGEAVRVTVTVPQADGRLLAELDRRAEIHARRYRDETVELDLRINRALLAQLLGRHPALGVVGDGGGTV